MAALFELVVNFGAEEVAAAAAGEIARTRGTVEVSGVAVPLDPSALQVRGADPYIEFTVRVRGVGGPVPPPGLDPASSTAAELTRPGNDLYPINHA